jgi:feruloyl esterase
MKLQLNLSVPRRHSVGLTCPLFYKGLPAFCRVAAVAKPTADSDIKLEIWLPVVGWNGKLQGLATADSPGLSTTCNWVWP